jgi:hypothetical protein
VVTFTGNASPYTLLQNVNITCTVTELVKIVTNTCRDFIGPAYTFGVGTTTYTATATDEAGLSGSATVTFVVTANATDLCTLTTSFSTKEAVANSLCAKLDAAAAALARGDTKAHDNQLDAYKNEVAAQAGRAFTDAQAAILTAVAGSL